MRQGIVISAPDEVAYINGFYWPREADGKRQGRLYFRTRGQHGAKAAWIGADTGCELQSLAKRKEIERFVGWAR